jgi:hypothetical protein
MVVKVMQQKLHMAEQQARQGGGAEGGGEQ